MKIFSHGSAFGNALVPRSFLLSICAVVVMLTVFQAVVPCQAATNAAAVRVGSELEFRPYAFVDENGAPAGFSVDLIKAIAEIMGLPLTISTGTWDNIWSDLVAGRLDLLPLVAKLPERSGLVDFSLPHTETYDAFFCRDGERPIPDIAAAQGREIVVMRSDAAHHALLERNFQGPLILVDSIPEGLSLIAAGRHDAFLCSKLIGIMAIKRHGLTGLVAGPPIPDYKRVFSFAVKKGETELLEKLNQGLLIVKTNGAYDRIYLKWFTHDDPWQRVTKYFLPTIAFLIAAFLVGGLWVLMLQRQVKKRTRELAEINTRLDRSRGALEETVSIRETELSAANTALQTEISVRRQIEDRVLQQNRILAGINRIFSEALTSDTIEQLGRSCLKVAEEITGSRFGFVGEIGPDGLLHDIAMSDPGWELCAMAEQTGQRRASGNFKIHGLYGRVLLDGKPFFTNDPSAHPDSIGTPAGHPPLTAFLGAPLRADGKTIGMVGLGNREGGYRHEDLEALESLSVAIVQAIVRRRAEETLTRSESRYRELVQNANSAIIRWRPDGAITYFNEYARNFFGYDEEEVLGRHIGILLPAQDYTGSDLTGLAQEVARHPEKYENIVNENICRDGRLVWMAWTNRPIFDEQGRPQEILSVGSDITAYKRAEEAWREAEARYRTLYENMVEEVHYWKVVRDEAGLVRTWRLVDANPPTLRTWGRTLDEIRGRTTDEIFGPGAMEHYLPVVRKIMSGGVPYTYEDYFPNLDKWFRFTSIPLGEYFITTGADISEAKRAAERLRQENREMALANRILREFVQKTGDEMYDSALAAIMEGMESRHGIFGYIDELGQLICPSMTKMLDQCEIEGKCIHYPPEKWKGLWAQALLEKQTFYTNTPVQVPPGHPPVANNLAVPILFQDKAIGLINLANKESGYTEEDRKFMDAIAGRIAPVLFAWVQKALRESERRHADAVLAEYRNHLEKLVEKRTADLQAAHDQLRHAEKLTAIGKLSASIAHEFNNPLFGIRNVMAGIKRRVPLEAEDAELVDMALKECDRIKYLIQSLQDFYRPTNGKPAAIQVHQIIDNMLLLVKSEFQKKKINLVKQYAPQLPNIVAVADQITQVLLNLLKNAGEAISEGGGTITITTENRGDQVVIQIQDSGAGIQPEQMKHIFEPFFTTKPEVKGTGLGLSVSHGIVKAHGGRIEVASESGRGSTFTIFLPMGGERADENQARSAG